MKARKPEGARVGIHSFPPLFFTVGIVPPSPFYQTPTLPPWEISSSGCNADRVLWSLIILTNEACGVCAVRMNRVVSKSRSRPHLADPFTPISPRRYGELRFHSICPRARSTEQEHIYVYYKYLSPVSISPSSYLMTSSRYGLYIHSGVIHMKIVFGFVLCP